MEKDNLVLLALLPPPEPFVGAFEIVVPTFCWNLPQSSFYILSALLNLLQIRQYYVITYTEQHTYVSCMSSLRANKLILLLIRHVLTFDV